MFNEIDGYENSILMYLCDQKYPKHYTTLLFQKIYTNIELENEKVCQVSKYIQVLPFLTHAKLNWDMTMHTDFKVLPIRV